MSRWNAGDHIILREVWHGRVWTARPVTVVEDSDQVITLYIANGSRWKRPFQADGSPKRIPAGDWMLCDDLWTNDVLRISVPGERISVLPFHDVDGTLRLWYVNIETPLERTDLGFDYMDQTLDIIVDGHLETWRWKDEEELAEAVARGVYKPEEADEIRHAGEAALKRFLSRNPPWDRDWEAWSPDPNWAVPQLTPGWDAVEPTVPQ
jgi:hypothetical protein